MNINMKTELNMNMKTKTEMPKIVPAKKLRGCGGFTIVELVVASVVLLVIIISLAATMRYMRREQNLDYHRRQARAVINRTFENVFAYTFFPGDYVFDGTRVFIGYKDEDGNITNVVTDEPVWEPLRISVDHINTLFERTLASSDFEDGGFDIDRRGGDYASVPADMYVRVEYIPETIDGDFIPTHVVTLTVEWKEVGETVPERVTLTKRLAGVL